MGRWVAIRATMGGNKDENLFRANEQKLKSVLDTIDSTKGAIVVLGMNLSSCIQAEKTAAETKEFLESFPQINFAGLDHQKNIFAYRTLRVSAKEAAQMCEYPLQKVWVFDDKPGVAMVEW